MEKAAAAARAAKREAEEEAEKKAARAKAAKEKAEKEAAAEKARKLAEKKAEYQRKWKEAQEKKKAAKAAAAAKAAKEKREAAAAQKRANSKARKGAVNSWYGKVASAVSRRWHRPPDSSGNKGIVKITVSPSGFISGGIKVTSCTGTPAFCASIKEAVERAEPLPRPPSKYNFSKSERTFSFRMD